MSPSVRIGVRIYLECPGRPDTSAAPSGGLLWPIRLRLGAPTQVPGRRRETQGGEAWRQKARADEDGCMWEGPPFAMRSVGSVAPHSGSLRGLMRLRLRGRPAAALRRLWRLLLRRLRR